MFKNTCQQTGNMQRFSGDIIGTLSGARICAPQLIQTSKCVTRCSLNNSVVTADLTVTGQTIDGKTAAWNDIWILPVIQILVEHILQTYKPWLMALKIITAAQLEQRLLVMLYNLGFVCDRLWTHHVHTIRLSVNDWN